jgi:hypothetical protein
MEKNYPSAHEKLVERACVSAKKALTGDVTVHKMSAARETCCLAAYTSRVAPSIPPRRSPQPHHNSANMETCLRSSSAFGVTLAGPFFEPLFDVPLATLARAADAGGAGPPPFPPSPPPPPWPPPRFPPSDLPPFVPSAPIASAAATSLFHTLSLPSSEAVMTRPSSRALTAQTAPPWLRNTRRKVHVAGSHSAAVISAPVLQIGQGNTNGRSASRISMLRFSTTPPAHADG